MFPTLGFVVIPTLSAAGKNIPVFVSPEFAIEGEPAEPSATA